MLLLLQLLLGKSLLFLSLLLCGDGFGLVIVQNLRVPAIRKENKNIRQELPASKPMNRGQCQSSAYIMTRHVSMGRSASLKLQSNFSSATGSSVGS
jgi:hypothetical protein